MDFSAEVIVVFSHLRWNFVYQRPQHLLSRLATKWRIIFVEEPVHDMGESHWEFNTPAPNVLVACPHTPIAEPGFSDAQIEALYPLIEALKYTAAISNAIAWLYTPLALPLAQWLQPRLSVYDCMDELSLFLHAPPNLEPGKPNSCGGWMLSLRVAPAFTGPNKGNIPTCIVFPVVWKLHTFTKLGPQLRVAV